MLAMTTDQMVRLDKAIQSAFDRTALKRLVLFGLGEHLDIISEDGPLPVVVYNLLKWVEQQGRVNILANAIKDERPDNQQVQAIANEILADAIDAPAPSSLTDRDYSRAEIQDRQLRWAKHLGVEVEVSLKIGDQRIELVLLPPGKFWMGSPVTEPGRRLNENQRPAEVSEPLFVGRFPITQAQFAKVLKHNPSIFGWRYFAGNAAEQAKCVDRPVETVTWDDAIAFCAALTERANGGPAFRLPTEEEWEYACRGGACGRDSRPFHLHDGPANALSPAKALFDAGTGSPGHTCPVKEYQPNRFGLSHLHGNVSEWCYPAEDDSVVPGPGVDDRVVRGGGFQSPAAECRAAARDWIDYRSKLRDLGFRIVRPVRRP